MQYFGNSDRNTRMQSVYSSYQLINQLVLNNVATSTIQRKHVLFAIICLEFCAINRNWLQFHETCNKNDDKNIINTQTPLCFAHIMHFNKIVFMAIFYRNTIFHLELELFIEFEIGVCTEMI